MALDGKHQMQQAQDAFSKIWRSKWQQGDESITESYRAMMLLCEGVKMALEDIHKHVGGNP